MNLNEALAEMNETLGLFDADYQRYVFNIGRLVIRIEDLI